MRLAALKVKYLLLPMISDGAATGVVRMDFYYFWLSVAQRWPACVSAIEGVDTMIQVEAFKAPAAGLALIDARVAIRKEFGKGPNHIASLK